MEPIKNVNVFHQKNQLPVVVFCNKNNDPIFL